MKFELTASGYYYSEEDAVEYRKLGFDMEDTRQTLPGLRRSPRYAFVRRGDPTIEITTLEELAAFANEWGPLVFNEDSIEIYDDYRE